MKNIANKAVSKATKQEVVKEPMDFKSGQNRMLRLVNRITINSKVD